MDKRLYWLWLQHAFSAGSSKPKSIYRRFSSLEEFFEGGILLWSSLRFLNEKDISLLSSYSLHQAEATIEYCERTGKKVICPECENYPSALWNINDPPSILYVKGKMPDFDNDLSIAVVGSRKTSELALQTAEKITYELSKEGVIVVSGGAVGVDTAAHKGALQGVSPTVAVLGCGLDFPYLMENELLRQRIVNKGGALITEYPPSMGVQRGTFQARNRIISGISKGTLIVSAEMKSGSMITARRALEQNKDIFAVPGSPMLPTSEGPNSLIKDGAVPVTNGADIIKYYNKNRTEINESPFYQIGFKEVSLENEAEKTSDKTDIHSDIISANGLKGDSALLIRALSYEPLHISEIEEKTSLSASKILACITELELLDIVASYSGQRYALNKG